MVLPFSSMNVDIYGQCNLRCRFCPEGMKLNEQPALRMSFVLFQQWIGPLLPGLRQIELFNWSEPLLHEELFEILHWTAERSHDVAVRLSTNGTLIDQEVSERLICSPVQALTITIAGLNREDYLYYHGVDALESVINSLRILAFTKRQLGSPTPRIRLRYLRFPFNFVSRYGLWRWVKKHLGSHASSIDSVSIRDGYLCGSTLSDQEIKKAYGIDPKEVSPIIIPNYHRCLKTCENPSVRADGAVFPCCAIPYRKEYVMGFLGKASFEDIWNGTPYRSFRESFMEGTNPICRNCFFRYLRVPLKLDRHFFQRVRFRIRMKRVGPGYPRKTNAYRLFLC